MVPTLIAIAWAPTLIKSWKLSRAPSRMIASGSSFLVVNFSPGWSSLGSGRTLAAIIPSTIATITLSTGCRFPEMVKGANGSSLIKTAATATAPALASPQTIDGPTCTTLGLRMIGSGSPSMQSR